MIIKDYQIYQLNRKERLGAVLEGMVLNAIVSYLFYNTWIAMIPGVLIVWVYIRDKKHVLMRKRLYRIREEFKEFLDALIAALQTGKSMENAFAEALKDTWEYVEKNTEFVLEMKYLCKSITLGESLEKLLKDFAQRSCLEELEYFAEVFQVGKRSGGNIVGIMRNTIWMLQEKMEAEAEIYAVLAEKRLEFQVMSVIPLGIILYLRIGAGNLLESLYQNGVGIVVMTGCLLVYGGCYLYGKRLLEIDA